MSSSSAILSRLSSSITLNDIGFRVIFIPLVGIAIGAFAGIVDGNVLNQWQFKLAYLFCILISFTVWNGNRYLLHFLRSYFNWIEKPLYKLVAIVLIIPAYTIPISILLLYIFYNIFYDHIDSEKIKTTSIAILVVTAFIVHVYETAYTVKEVENEKLTKETLEKLKAESELAALKAQLDPHFMINSLNTLSYLIENDAIKANVFNQNLADLFRYMLQSKERDLVMLSEELDFLNKYLNLISIRFGDSIIITTDIDEKMFSAYLLPSISLQLLAENAIKHNNFSKKQPLKINIYLINDHLEFVNNVSDNAAATTSTGIGLKNLNQRFKLLTGEAITIVNNFDTFIVKLPLKKI